MGNKRELSVINWLFIYNRILISDLLILQSSVIFNRSLYIIQVIINSPIA